MAGAPVSGAPDHPASHDALRATVAHLAAMVRDSAGPGERASAAWLAGRLPGARVEAYRGQRTYVPAHALHGLLGLAGGPAALLALALLEGEVSGRRPLLRCLLAASEGATVVAHRPGAGPADPALVVVAHHDAARTGLIWHPRLHAATAGRAARRRRIEGFHLPVAAGMVLAALPWRPARRAGRAVLALFLAALADVARSPTVPGASDNATGVAAALALHADAPAGLDLWTVLPGAEESGMDGFRAFLARHGDDLDPARTLVLGLDTLGAGTPIVLSGEGSLREHRYDPADLDLVDAAADRAGLPRPPRWRIGGWTDPILARFAGLRAVSLLAMGDGRIPRYHRPDDVPEHVDWDSVAACLSLARAIAEEWRLSAR